MSFQPDLIVVDSESLRPAMVVDVKLRILDLPATERHLKDFMFKVRCRVGLLVTPEQIWIYK